ncbi:MAG: SGNH/GDSL hydrolase family protein [Planctomycetes bacterium]|nr:SGNH/GDSL hydrolase family protein [Planctomycetota bacterium]
MRLKKRLLVLCGVAAVAISAVVAYVHFNLSRPVGRGPAGPIVARQAFERPWTSRPALLLGLGDSVTAGFGSTPGHSYFERLFRNPADEWEDMMGLCLGAVMPGLTASNLSLSGSTSLEHIETIRKMPVAAEDALGIVVITTGGNDIIHNYGRTPPREGAMYGATWEQAEPWVAAFESRLDEMMMTLKRKFPGGCHVFLANIFDPTDAEGDIANAGLPAWSDGVRVLAAYNEVIARVAKRHSHVHLVDMRGVMLGHGIHCKQPWAEHYDSKDPHYWYFSNLEDPNDRGYDAIRRVFLKEIAGVMQAERK